MKKGSQRMRLAAPFSICLLLFGGATEAQKVERVLRIGVVDGDPQYIFTRPGQVQALPDHRILVVEGLDAQFRVYDAQGRFVRSFGRRGRGPGEFLMPFGIVTRDSLLHINDASLRRITTFTLSGRYVTDRRMPDWPVSGMSSLSALSNGFAITASNPSYGTRGVFLDVAVQLLREKDARVDTLLTYPSGIVLLRNGRNLSSGAVRLGNGGAWATSGDSMVVLLDALRGALTWYWVGEDGLREWKRASLRWQPQSVTRADRGEIEERVRAGQPNLGSQALDLIVPRYWGRVGRMLVASDGTAWLNLTDRLDSTDDWLLVSPGSITTRRVTLPARFFMWSLQGDRLYGVEKDENDVPFVAVYRITN